MAQYNQWFKQLRLAHGLDRTGVVEVMTLGGLTITKSRADGWMRRAGDDRYHEMTEREFDYFVTGLLRHSEQKRR